MQCPQCQQENPTEAKFCLHCGTKLVLVCPQCQQVLPSEAKFCLACGQPLQAEPPPPELAIPEAERRQLTVMFCDLADSTQLSGQLDLEELREVIRAYQETAADVVLHYEGHIAQYLGDGLLVYFGWPRAHEDDARRGVHAGLGITQAMETLNGHLEADKGIRLAVRIGVHTGPVVIGEMGGGGRHERLALGETTNIASRLEGLAQINTVVLSDTTYRLVRGYFHCDDLGSHTLKGVATPMHTYRVREATGIQGRLDGASVRGLTPLVGRQQEVGVLLQCWEQVRNGQGQVVLLHGEAGIGKSRLAQVLKAHVADESSTHLECRSSPYYQHTALYPLTDLLQRVLQWHSDDAPAAKLEKLERLLQRYRLPLEETVPLLAGLLALPLPEDQYPPLTWTPQRQRQKTLEYIVAMLLELAERQPVLFVLEDLHWIDPTSLELLDLLMARIPTAAICLLLTCRPEFQATWSSRPYLTQVTLNRLPQHQIERIAAQVADGKSLPGEVLQQIIEKTDGVPLFAEEMTKAVLESGHLQEIGRHYELRRPFTSLAIPATLQDSLMARLDRLVTGKAVAQYAAVIGRQFSYALLHTVLQLDEATLQRELARLVEAELVYQRGVPPQATYLFKHALVVDAAYASLLKSTRQQYHRRIAQILEERFPDTAQTQPELLAHHCTAAGLPEKALAYWRRAGRRAMQRSAPTEARAHFSAGLALLEALPDTPARQQHELMLLTALGSALIASQGYSFPGVEQTYSRARELCRRMGETPRLLQALLGLQAHYFIRAKLRTAYELAEQCLGLAQRLDHTRLLHAHLALGLPLFYLGDGHTARHHLETGFSLYNPQQHHDPRSLQDPGVTCLIFTALTLWWLGYPEQALVKSHEALTLAHDLAHPFSLTIALSFAAALHQWRREVPQTLQQTEAALALATEQGFSFYITYGIIMRGWALAEQGQVEAGIEQMRQGLRAYRDTGTEIGKQRWHSMLAAGYGKAGQVAEGLRALENAFALENHDAEHIDEAGLYRLRGELLLMRQATRRSEADAAACFHQALSIARRQQAKSLELRAATSLARLWQSQDKRQEASDLLAPVYAWFTEGFDTADLQEAKALLDELT